MRVGNSLAGNGRAALDESVFSQWAAVIKRLQQCGLEIAVVSSGAIIEGASRLGWFQEPSDIARLQAAAAVGQISLANAYEVAFRREGLCSAQFLLTQDDFSTRERHLNLRAALHKLMSLGVIPVINENRAVNTPKNRTDESDILATSVAQLVEADRILILVGKKFAGTGEFYSAIEIGA